MRQIDHTQAQALYSVEATRQMERAAASALPPHTLMARAGLAVARLAQALRPHARSIWVACGPGNNGGDGLIAATHLHRWAQANGGAEVWVTHFLGDPADESRLPADARNALNQARAAGLRFCAEPPASWDLAIDALLGIGATRAPQGTMARWMEQLQTSTTPVLCVDVPSGLNADTGQWVDMSTLTQPTRGATPHGPRHTLTLLTVKPGLFTAQGRDAAGVVWFDDLGINPEPDAPVSVWLSGHSGCGVATSPPPHASHKGSFGDVLVIGGQDMAVDGAGMTGAALLAARAALHAGAGRVFVGLLEAPSPVSNVRWDPVCPELMFRQIDPLLESELLKTAGVVCGCGGGSAVARVLPRVLSRAPRLVLDADALNAVAADSALQTLLRQRSARGWFTVITPHPLEAARLLGSDTATVMADRLLAARTLSERFGVVCVLKGSGTLIVAPGQIPRINPTGNAALATAGTGDVLAGMIGRAVALPGGTERHRLDLVAGSVFQHGWLADHWSTEDAPPGHRTEALSASRLAARVRPMGGV
ncbi:MAG: hypothetical protein A2W72_09440 [Burkholderiales bacterium RIFCSPLOWO2_12_67_14]|nr:MAG: hypothetical protein A3I64_05295 [Burkholderiales bacterium RIFCSPLOWO2_02_FULL_67_64]OGB39922.1 MAG: hypothetical protein A2W72_09440 [Burkholderiales bacterium RIFCSPLOWO2_12_67_14]OGB52576.1 MAG: hypothetical protein A3E51_13755 [Burkholderiales bacterium RIFCSPHIGHO2_12_FULL_67_38]OGB93417.1 MAG: hypothetical protein A3G82_08010 [Burkholderiales bacterium RIFCSPLOWO2_12_FULL_67_210]